MECKWHPTTSGIAEQNCRNAEQSEKIPFNLRPHGLIIEECRW